MTTTSTNGNGILRISTRSLGKPSASYPGSVATDQHLAIAVDRQQTTLAVAMGILDTSMTVASAAQIVTWSLLSIDNEIVQVTGPATGNVVPITRGWDGTTPAIHVSGTTVSGLVDAYHHNTLVAEIEAIEQALGANLANIPGTTAFVLNGPFIFPPQTPGGSLIVGNNVVTLTPVPRGVNGTDTNHYLYISGGTGAAEAVLITGGTAVGGAASGTVIVNCANTHSGAWTIATATGGIQEAIASLPSSGGLVLIVTNLTLWSSVYDMGKTGVVVWRMPWYSIVDNTVNRILNGYAMPFDRNYFFQNYPNASAQNLWGGTRFDMGGYPDAYRFGGNNSQATESLTGTIAIPANTGTRLGTFAGVAGYATTNYVGSGSTTTAAAVGVLGYAVLPVKNGAIWGSNFVISTTNVDVSGSVMFGCEIDIGHSTPSTGRAADLIGCMLVNDAVNTPVSSFIGYSSRLAGTSNPPFQTSFESAIGAAAHALWVGLANSVPNTVSNSQDVYFQSCNGIINLAATVWLDNNGNLITGLDEPNTVNVVQGGGFRIRPRTYGTLPTSPNLIEGVMCPITDCNTNTWGAVAGGGGTYHAMLYYNGTAWKVMCA